jgi:glutamate dehydrogenase (NADP+)
MDLAFPSMIQGEVNAEDAQALVNSGCTAVVENTDYACTGTAKHILRQNGTVIVPSKLASVGSVMATGRLLQLNAERQSPTKEVRM